MFSFWSNDEEENSDCSDESDSEKDKSAKPELFHYVGNEKRDESLSLSALKGNSVVQNKRNVNVFNERKRKMDDMLEDVWSVRKDVRVNANAVKATEIGTKSFYSRHAGVSGAGTNTDTLNGKNTFTDKAGGPTKTWSVPRSNYSYSDNTAINQYHDILDDNRTAPDCSKSLIPSDHNVEVQRRNIVNSLKHDTQGTGPKLSNRELSARTRRAQKFNNAYLRSTGLGKYTPGTKKPSDQHNDNDQSWRR